MSSKRIASRKWTSMGLPALMVAITAVAVAWWLFSMRGTTELENQEKAHREFMMSQLTLKDGRLFAPGEAQPFDGLLYENFPTSEDDSSPGRKLEIEIRAGMAHGRSVGYFKNHHLEVEEFFTDGVSNGLRTRWDEQGWKKSEEMIEHGTLNGRHVEWHANGKKALEMTMKNGQPDGVAEAWHENGNLKSRSRFVAGKLVERKFFTNQGM